MCAYGVGDVTVPLVPWDSRLFQELATEGKLDKTEWPTVYQKRYPRSWWYHLKLCTKKKLMLLLRDKAYLQSQVIGAIVMGEQAGLELELISVLAYVVHPKQVSQRSREESVVLVCFLLRGDQVLTIR